MSWGTELWDQFENLDKHTQDPQLNASSSTTMKRRMADYSGSEPFKLRPHPPRFLVPRSLQRERRSSRLWIAGPTATYTGYAGVHTPLSGVEMKKAYGGQCQWK
ncbi:unnamed protein product [Gadus morhua 'NCC']